MDDQFASMNAFRGDTSKFVEDQGSLLMGELNCLNDKFVVNMNIDHQIEYDKDGAPHPAHEMTMISPTTSGFFRRVKKGVGTVGRAIIRNVFGGRGSRRVAAVETVGHTAPPIANNKPKPIVTAPIINQSRTNVASVAVLNTDSNVVQSSTRIRTQSDNYNQIP